jgi:hypothetical protein
MDLSIRVIASILLATRVAPHQDTHTYRLSKLLKIHTAPPKKQAPAAKKRNYPLPTNTRQEEKRFCGGFLVSPARHEPTTAEEMGII